MRTTGTLIIFSYFIVCLALAVAYDMICTIADYFSKRRNRK